MTAESIKEYLRASPFVPFTVRVPDYPPMRVPYPDFAHLSPKGKTMFVFTEKGEGVRMLDVVMITVLEPEQQGR